MLKEEQEAARKRMRAAGLVAAAEIRSELHPIIIKFAKRPPAIPRLGEVLAPVLAGMDRAHEAFLAAAVRQLQSEPAAALLRDPAIEWIADDASRMLEVLTAAGRGAAQPFQDGLFIYEIPGGAKLYGEQVSVVGGSYLIDYAAGGHVNDVTRAEYDRRHVLREGARARIRELLESPPKMSEREVLALLGVEPELALKVSELSRRTGWNRNTFRKSKKWSARLERFRATAAIGRVEHDRHKRGSRVLHVPPPDEASD